MGQLDLLQQSSLLMKRHQIRALAAGLTLALAAWGCAESKPSVETSLEEATVKGLVSIQGKPVTHGEVTFDAANYLRRDVQARTVPIQKDGSYTISTPIGENRVTLTTPETAKGRLATQEIHCQVKEGSNDFNIDVVSAPTRRGR
ncbi:MAG: hypothetical protein U0794_05720 [Isosphaeraceae bacterium]